MFRLLFSANGRINRARLWLAVLLQIIGGVALSVALSLMWQVLPGSVGEDGQFSLEGPRAVPYLALMLGYVGAALWSGICIGIKRFHDRGKSGAWVLVQFVPVIGSIWYFVEVGCLAGTAGPNRYGPDPIPVPAPAGLAA